jgi:hypothetical protein
VALLFGGFVDLVTSGKLDLIKGSMELDAQFAPEEQFGVVSMTWLQPTLTLPRSGTLQKMETSLLRTLSPGPIKSFGGSVISGTNGELPEIRGRLVKVALSVPIPYLIMVNQLIFISFITFFSLINDHAFF